MTEACEPVAAPQRGGIKTLKPSQGVAAMDLKVPKTPREAAPAPANPPPGKPDTTLAGGAVGMLPPDGGGVLLDPRCCREVALSCPLKASSRGVPLCHRKEGR